MDLCIKSRIRRHTRWCLAASVVVFAAGSAFAESITLGAAKDNTLFEDPTGSLSNGAGSYLFAGTTGQDAKRRGLIAFDVSAIPAGSIVQSVTLTMHMSRTITGGEEVTLHRALLDWGQASSDATDEEGGGAAAQPGDATWIHAVSPSTTWANEGGDFDAAPSAMALVFGMGFYSWSSALLVSDVQAWVNNPALNTGWAIIGNEGATGTAKRFDSRENENPTMRPSLSIEYVIPAPSTLALLVLPVMAARRRIR